MVVSRECDLGPKKQRQESNAEAIAMVAQRVSIGEPVDGSLGRSHVPGNRVDPADPTDRRAAILEGALELFAVRGYRETTMADVGQRAGIRGPSIYKYFASKQEMLAEIMITTMDCILCNYDTAVAEASDTTDQLKRAVEAHVRYQARHRLEACVSNREIQSLDEPSRSMLLDRRDKYERGFRDLIERGRAEGNFRVTSPRLASYAILDMGIGVSVWFREDGPIEEDRIVRYYGSMALHIVGIVQPSEDS